LCPRGQITHYFFNQSGVVLARPVITSQLHLYCKINGRAGKSIDIEIGKIYDNMEGRLWRYCSDAAKTKGFLPVTDSLQKLALSRTFAMCNGVLEPVDEAAQGPSTEAELGAGTVLDSKYRIIELIGTGGMGAVYKVHHLLLQKEMALKTFRSHSLSQEAWHRFQREAQAIARLKHKNIVEVFDFGIAQTRLPYYTMELLAGESLADRLASSGKVDPQEALWIFLQTAEALAHAHRQQIVHRDIKPANIFLQERLGKGSGSLVKIVDFGIAKLAEDSPATANQSVTQVGTIFGSPLYMSPEQSLGLAVDQRTDIYSFGCALFESLVGHPPLVGDTALITLLNHQTKMPPRLKDVLVDVELPQRLDSLMARLLAKTPEKRYQTFEEIVSDLNYCIEDLSTKQSIKKPAAVDSEPVDQGEPEALRKLSAVVRPAMMVGTLAVALAIGFLLFNYVTQPNHNRAATDAATGPAAKAAANALVPNRGRTPAGSVPEQFEKERAEACKSKIPFLVNPTKIARYFLFPDYTSLGSIRDGRQGKKQNCIGTVPVSPDNSLFFAAAREVCNHPQLLERFAPDALYGLQLRDQDIGESHWTSDKLQHITKLQSLRELNVGHTSVDAQAIGYIGQLSSLEALDIHDTDIVGEDLTKLKTLPQLTEMTLNQVHNLPALFHFMAQNPSKYHLKKLTANKCHLNDENLKDIARLKTLESLQLVNNEIHGPGLEYLTDLPDLHELFIRKNHLQSNALDTIANIKSLRKLEIDKNPFNKDDWAKLRQRLPFCSI
jgi:serine/threonine protein kinase